MAFDAFRRIRVGYSLSRCGFDVMWPRFLAVAGIGALFFGLAVLRARSMVAQAS
jgi:hypothetical protein